MVCWRKGARCLFLAGTYRVCLSLGLLSSLIPETIRNLAPPMAVHTCLPACSCCVGILHVSDRRFFTAVVLTIIPNGPWKRGLSMASGQLASQRGT